MIVILSSQSSKNKDGKAPKSMIFLPKTHLMLYDTAKRPFQSPCPLSHDEYFPYAIVVMSTK